MTTLASAGTSTANVAIGCWAPITLGWPWQLGSSDAAIPVIASVTWAIRFADGSTTFLTAASESEARMLADVRSRRDTPVRGPVVGVEVASR